MDMVKNLKSLGYFLGILLMIIGIIFIAIPGQIISFMAILLGAILLVSGIFRIIVVLVKWKELRNQILLLLLGIILVAIGLYAIINTQATITFIGIILGIFAILLAIDRFISAFERKEKESIVPAVIFGLIHLAFGIGLIVAAVTMLTIVTILYGVYFIAAGLMVILSMMLFDDF